MYDELDPTPESAGPSDSPASHAPPGGESADDPDSAQPDQWEDEDYLDRLQAEHDAFAEYLQIRAEKAFKSNATHKSFETEFDLMAHEYAAFIDVDTDAGPLPLIDSDGQIDTAALDMYKRDGEIRIKSAIANSLPGKALDRVEQAAAFDPPVIEYKTLADLLAADLPDLEYRVEGLTLVGGVSLLAAPAKAAKTTFTMCLCRSLLSGSDFLGRKVRPVQEDRRIVYWDCELELRYAADQFRRLGIERDDAISLIPMKGQSVPFTTAEGKDWIVAHLLELNAEIWVIDTFSRVFNAEENSNTEVNAFVRELDEIKRRADLKDIVIVHHAGHEQKNKPQRARGASALEGWPDTLLTIERVNPNNAEDTQRTLRAKGRGVTVPELHYDWDPDAFELTRLDRVRKTSAASTKADGTREQNRLAVHKYIVDNPRSMQAEIAEAVDLSVGKVRNLLQELVGAGRVQFAKGDGRDGTVQNGKYYFGTDEANSDE